MPEDDLAGIIDIRSRHNLSGDHDMFFWLDKLGSAAEELIGLYHEQDVPLPEVFGQCLREMDEISHQTCELVNILHNPTLITDKMGPEAMMLQLKECAKFLYGKLKHEKEEPEKPAEPQV